jgi:hypothetical protein
MVLTGSCQYTKFPELYGKMSSTNKVKRMVRQLKQACSSSFQAGRRAYLCEYVPLIYQLVVKKLTENKEDVLEAVETIKQQGLNVELFKENILSLLMDTSADIFNNLDSRIKTVFTKAYNQACQSSVKRVKAKRAAGGEMAGMQGVYKDGFDPDIMEDDLDVARDSSASVSNEEFEVVGKSKEVNAAASRGRGRSTTPTRGIQAPRGSATSRGGGSARGSRGRGRG